MKKIVALLALGVILGVAHTASAQIFADTVLYNGKILTADSEKPADFSIAQAVAIFGGKFVGVGSSEEILKMAGPQTRRIDLGGRTVMPGRIHSHSHLQDEANRRFMGGGGRARMSNVGMTAGILWANKEEGLAQVRTIVLSKKPGEWVIIEPTFSADSGFVNITAALPPQFVQSLPLADLDRVAPNNPLNLTGYVYEEGLANSAALKILLDKYPDIRGVTRDSQGKPTGFLRGMAQRTMGLSLWPDTDVRVLADAYRKVAERFHYMGVTTVSTRVERDPLRGFHYLDARGEMPIRLAYASEAVVDQPDPEGFLRRYDTAPGAGTQWLWNIGMSFGNIDGVTGAAGDCLSKAYPREAREFPLWRFQFFGPYGDCYMRSKDHNYKEAFEAVIKNDGRISGGHVAGDGAVDDYFELLEQFAGKYNIAERRFGLDHCRSVRPDQVARAAKLGIAFSCGSPSVNQEGTGRDAMEIVFGPEQGAEMKNPFRSLLDAGLKVALEGEGIYTFTAMENAITRAYQNGRILAPKQRISRQEALYGVTQWSAWYVLREKEIGSIEVGKLADLAVLDRDYLTIPENDIRNIDVLMTILGGKIVYTEAKFATAMGLPQVGYRGDTRTFRRGRPDDINE